MDSGTMGRMAHRLYPLLLAPRPSRRLWGGSRLAPMLDVRVADGEDPIGEAWLVYAENIVQNGVHSGKSLQDVADDLGPELVGRAAVARYGTRVPLLVKLIDAAKPLSIQVHPDDAYARREEAESGHLGKEEAWYILAADEDAEIVWGLERNATPEEVREAVREERLETLVNSVDVSPGDVIYNPAGRIHAIGAGIFLFEVQQSSDLTYRLYDYGRRDASGQTRELHLDKALEVADLQATHDAKVKPRQREDGWTELVSTPFFVMEKRDLARSLDAETSMATLETLTFVSGGGTVAAVDSGRHDPDGAVAFGFESVVLPAAMGRYRVEGSGELIRCRLP